MDSFKNQPWGFSNQDVGQLSEDDFMAFVQKQFPGLSSIGPIPGFPPFNEAVNPQNVSTYSVSTLTPPASEDSSPSPSNSNQDQVQEGNEDPILKRKASSNRLGSEPSNKTQHTESSADKHSAPGMTQATRRKSSGHTPKDEHRLLKRKEQNRAAQRAFRERKEKHVKDLEDKVAELEAKHEATQHENENLRDMLGRLQSENMSLKQSAFTFSVQKDSETPSTDNNPPSRSVYSSAGSMVSSNPTPISPKLSNPLDWSSLTSFNPNILNILDENVTQPTATDSAMQMNFDFGTYTGLPTIAENQTFMTPASIFDKLNDTSNQTSATGIYPNNSGNENSTFNQFDLNTLSWPGTASNLSSNPTNPDSIFDDPYSAYLSTLTGQEFGPLAGSTPSLSPVTHQTLPPSLVARSSSVASSLSPPVLGTDSLFTPPADSPRTEPDAATSAAAETAELAGQVPRSRSQCRKAIANGGDSIFAPPLQKSNDEVLGPTITCAGSKIPITEKNDQNVEILAAFKAMRADPRFRNLDISSLCDEFKEKACCDGTKVVLEPGALSEIKENLSKNRPL